MQQSEHALPAPTGGRPVAPSRATDAHPVWRYGLIFGGLSGLFAVLQLSVSVTSAVENRAAFASLYYGVQNQALDPTVILRWLGPVLVATYTSCLLGFALSMWLCWHAGRAAAAASGRRSFGALAGMLASMIGTLIWIVASVAAVLLVHTDGSISGIFTTNPIHPTASTGGAIAGLVVQEAVAGLIALGFAAIAGRLGAATAQMPPSTAVLTRSPWPGAPTLASYPTAYGPTFAPPVPPNPPGAPALTPPPARPFVVAPMYPPPPEYYRAQQNGAPFASPTPTYGAPGAQPPTPYPSYPPYPGQPGYPPRQWAPPPFAASAPEEPPSPPPANPATPQPPDEDRPDDPPAR